MALPAKGDESRVKPVRTGRFPLDSGVAAPRRLSAASVSRGLDHASLAASTAVDVYNNAHGMPAKIPAWNTRKAFEVSDRANALHRRSTLTFGSGGNRFIA